jgi:hypothetical protein
MKHLWIISALLVPGCALLPYPFDQGEYPSPFVEAKVERTPPMARLSVAAFHARSREFEGQVIEVTGTITNTSRKGGCAGATMTDDGIYRQGTEAHVIFGRKQKPMAGRLQIGERVTFRGIVKPTYSGPWMESAVRVDKPAQAG